MMKPSLPPQSKHIKAGGMDSAAANKPQEAAMATGRGAGTLDNVSLTRRMCDVSAALAACSSQHSLPCGGWTSLTLVSAVSG